MKVLCSMVMTADGYIARVDGRSTSSPYEWDIFSENAQKYQNFVVGRKTYTLARESLQKIDAKYRIIISAEPEFQADAGFTVVRTPEAAIEMLKDSVDTLFLVGGNVTNTSFLQRSLITDLEVLVLPLIIGNGMPLFSPFELEQKLSVISYEKIHGDRIKIHYKIV